MGAGEARALALALVLVFAATAAGQDDGLDGPPVRSKYAKRLERRASQVRSTYQRGLVIRGTPRAVRKTRADLDLLKRTAMGRALLKALLASGRYATIHTFSEPEGANDPVQPEHAERRANGRRGKGSDSLVYYNPDFAPFGVNPVSILGHELIHALHAARGAEVFGEIERGPNEGEDIEEHRTIGTPPYDKLPFTENRLRAELNRLDPTRFNLPPRTSHDDDGAPGDDGPGREADEGQRPHTPTTGLTGALGKKLKD